MASDRRDHYFAVGANDLHAMAVEFRLGNRHFGWRELDHQRGYAGDAVVGRAQGSGCGGLATVVHKVIVSELLKPYDARLMRCYPISARINHVANDDEECSAPVELAQIQSRLFS